MGLAGRAGKASGEGNGGCLMKPGKEVTYQCEMNGVGGVQLRE